MSWLNHRMRARAIFSQMVCRAFVSSSIKVTYWILIGVLMGRASTALAQTPAPSPQRSFATVTVKIGENPDINVRSGPGVDYERIGTLLAGQEVPALGRSAGGDWVQISYPEGPDGLGWVYTYLVEINGELPIVIPPATPTPPITPTIDPTLAAQFIIEPLPTALPTFTPPPPLVIPTIPTSEASQDQRSAPLLYIMIALGALGLFSLLVSFIRMR
jgi:uncharacterized protein YraI